MLWRVTSGCVTFTSWEHEFVFEPGEPVTYTDPHVAGADPTTCATRTWESPIIESAFPASELIASWNARTPGRSWLEVEARVEVAGEWTDWLVLARWCELDREAGGAITRTTVPGQVSGPARVAVDTVLASEPFDTWQLRILAIAPDGRDEWPTLTLAGAVTAAFPEHYAPVTEGRGVGVELAVRPLSQRRHVDTFPHWDRGGQSWCSATSTAMVLDHWRAAPEPGEVAWVGHDTDPEVVHVVRHVFDAAYGGAGNWSFNVAYAATRGLRAHVTRLRDLNEAEAFVAAGIPLVATVSFTREDLPEAGYATKGHLLTIVGFTPEGDVICNDPNSHEVASNDEVRVVFPRRRFEKVWAGGSGGLVYVMHPPEQRLPQPPDQANW
jgi:hypothetical protein